MDAVQSGRVSASGWVRWLPGIATLRSYEARWLPHDIAAGLVLTTAVAPVGIAYAVASGLPGVYGLYATIVPLLAYALFGRSRYPGARARLRIGGCHSERNGSARHWRCQSRRRGFPE